MPAMRRLLLLLPVAALALAACSSSAESDKQWYKPNVDYTAADFERDRLACTDKKRKLDEECLKQRGWASLSGDIGPPIKPPDPAKTPSPKGSY
jgi:ABC-type phosphate/phosphonate transport system substrate-binding protein